MENLETKDFGELSVQLSPIGSFQGSDRDGNPIPENLTEESLSALAEKLNQGDEILADIDHASTRVGNNRDSSAVGWFSKFFVQPLKGLFATLRLTKRGKELVENREYRYLSPTFMLNENGEPVDLHSASFTNIPAFKGYINPILNSESNEILTDEKDILSMDINELKKLILDVISEMKEAEKTEEIKEEIKEEIVENEETTEEVKEETTETVEEEKTEEKPVETPAEETVSNETVEVVEIKTETVEVPSETEEEKKEEEEEVIKLEALNSSPNISISSEPEWKKLKGKAFFDWLKTHPNGN